MSVSTLFKCLCIIHCSNLAVSYPNGSMTNKVPQSQREQQLISMVESEQFTFTTPACSTTDSKYYALIERFCLAILERFEKFKYITKLTHFLDIIHQRTLSMGQNVLCLEFWNRAFTLYFSPKHTNIQVDYEFLKFLKRMIPPPTFDTFTIIIHGLSHHLQIKRPDEAISFLIQHLVQKRGLIRSSHYANRWMKLFKYKDLVEAAKSLWNCYETEQNLMDDCSWSTYYFSLHFLSTISRHPTNENWPLFWETATSFPNLFEYFSAESFRKYSRTCIRAISKFGKMSLFPSFFEIWRPYFQHFPERYVLVESQKLYVMAQLVRKHIFNETEGFDPWGSIIGNHNVTAKTMDKIVRLLSRRDLVLNNKVRYQPT